MSELAYTQLRQARGFLKAGQPARAVELLEKAALLEKDDRDLEQRILRELCAAYDAVGRPDLAARCRERVYFEEPAEAVEPAGEPTVVAPGRNRWSMPLILVATHAIVAMAAAGITWSLAHKDQTLPAPIPRPRAVTPTTGAAKTPKARPATSPVVMPISAVPPADRAALREMLLSDNVGKLVVMLHYEGRDNGQPRKCDVPVSTATAFAVQPGNVLVTTRSAVDLKNQTAYPPTLAAVGMPLLTLRDCVYLIAFPSAPTDPLPARLIYCSDRYDLALLKVEKAFARPLAITSDRPHQAESLNVCQTAGTNLDASTPSTEEINNRLRQAVATADPVKDLSLGQLKLAVAPARVQVPERNLEGNSYLQLSGSDLPQEDGVPVLNTQDEVVGILTSGRGKSGNAGQRYALLMEQLQDELAANAPRN